MTSLNMINWHKYPFVRLILPYAFGIWMAINLDFLNLKVNLSLLVFGLTTLLLSFLVVKKYQFRWIFGLLLHAVLFLGGAAQVKIIHQKAENVTIPALSENAFYIARVVESPVEKSQSVKLLLNLENVYRQEQELQAAKGKVLAYLKLDENLPSVQYGDQIAFSKMPVTIEAPSNPGQFDYRTYMARQGVKHQVFLRADEWKKTGINESNRVFRFSYKLRDKLLRSLKNNGLQGEEFAVASAILLGYDEVLPPYLRKGYVAAGAMHVLCVSGLHVGIIFLIAGFLLKFFGKANHTRYIKTILLLLIIWFYALLTGLSPSVQRASLMISFFLLGKLINRNGYALNSIAASAFFILMIDPLNIMNLGFQLSYAAVVGIVVLHRPIAASFYLKNSVLKYVWDITALALAAQIATTPFVIFYFHQFPVYFWVSNLFLVPLSFVIIVSGMALLILSFLPFLPAYLGMAVSGLIYFMNLGIKWIEALPFSVVKGLYINQYEFVISLILLLCVFIVVRWQRKVFVYLSLGASIVLLTSFSFRKIGHQQQSALIIYAVNRHTAIDFIRGTDHIIVADSNLKSSRQTIEYQLEGNWIDRGLGLNPEFVDLNENFSNTFLQTKGGFMSFQGQLLAIWNSDNFCEQPLAYKPIVDVMLIGNHQRENLAKVLNCYEVKQIVLDGSLPAYRAEKWQEACVQMNLPCHDVSRQGAYIRNF